MSPCCRNFQTITCNTLPRKLDLDSVYYVEPKNPDCSYYHARTDRNIGWITQSEQELLRNSVVGIAGCGGMGGLLSQILLRLGVGHIKLADIEVFDTSNINRQFGASRSSVGTSKALRTAELLRETSDDNTLTIYPQGISKDYVCDFVSDCDVICDEIEFWAIGARILLHQYARKQGVPVFNCNTVGFGTRLFLFTPSGFTMEDCLGCTLPHALQLQQKVQTRTASAGEICEAMEKVLQGLIPELPKYTTHLSPYHDLESSLQRLFEEGKAPIIATNPPMATGFLADHILFHLLQNSEVKRKIVRPPEAPGYLYFDAAKLTAKTVRRKGVDHE